MRSIIFLHRPSANKTGIGFDPNSRVYHASIRYTAFQKQSCPSDGARNCDALPIRLCTRTASVQRATASLQFIATLHASPRGCRNIWRVHLLLSFSSHLFHEVVYNRAYQLQQSSPRHAFHQRAPPLRPPRRKDHAPLRISHRTSPHHRIR
jgi:hypothetical protein